MQDEFKPQENAAGRIVQVRGDVAMSEHDTLGSRPWYRRSVDEGSRQPLRFDRKAVQPTLLHVNR